MAVYRAVIGPVTAHGMDGQAVFQINDWNSLHLGVLRLKLLVFEYITGGGFAGQALPASLAAEGRMMLQALLDDLTSVPNLELILPLDRRCLEFSLPPDIELVVVEADDEIDDLLPGLIAGADAVWPIAPETGGILANIAQRVKAAGKKCLLSDPETVALCGNKLATFERLQSRSLPVVETLALEGLSVSPYSVSVIKPVDGVGCDGSIILDRPEQLSAATVGLSDTDRYLIQPFCDGRAVSLSCLFQEGRAWLLCCNRQQIVIEANRFKLMGCVVNADNKRRTEYQALIDRIASAVPGLWGYIGIDLIETDEEAVILEINPRLTTSYVGIKQATGLNLAEQTLALLIGEPDLKISKQRAVKVVIESMLCKNTS